MIKQTMACLMAFYILVFSLNPLFCVLQYVLLKLGNKSQNHWGTSLSLHLFITAEGKLKTIPLPLAFWTIRELKSKLIYLDKHIKRTQKKFVFAFPNWPGYVFHPSQPALFWQCIFPTRFLTWENHCRLLTMREHSMISEESYWLLGLGEFW